ncbi:MAG: type II secretion system protein, partial [Lentisphaeria bacterium]
MHEDAGQPSFLPCVISRSALCFGLHNGLSVLQEPHVRSARSIQARKEGLCPGRRAFTLVELLIVVAIVAILVGMVLPTLAKAGALAKMVHCQGRLKQWGVLFEIYAADSGGVYP